MTNKVSDTAIETGNSEEVASSLTVEESGLPDLDFSVEADLENLLGRGKIQIQCQPSCNF